MKGSTKIAAGANTSRLHPEEPHTFRTSQRTPQPARRATQQAREQARRSWNANDIVARSVHDIPVSVGHHRRLALP